MTKPLISSRRAFLAWAGSGAALMLAGCGGTSIVDRLNPQRFLIVGDGFHDQGQTGSLPTVNDGSPTTWLQQMAAYYGNVATVKPANQGGTAWAQAFAMISSPDTASGTGAPSVQTQIDQMLADITITNDDLVFINGGMADIVQAVEQTGISDATTATVQAAAHALFKQVQRLTQNGANHVAVVGVYDLKISPWAAETGLSGDDITKLTVGMGNKPGFNNWLEIELENANLGSKVLYLDAALFYNLIYKSPGDYGLSNVTDPVCTTPTALTCNTGTVVNSSYNTYMFADDLHFTPALQLMFGLSNYGKNGYQSLIDRW